MLFIYYYKNYNYYYLSIKKYKKITFSEKNSKSDIFRFLAEFSKF